MIETNAFTENWILALIIISAKVLTLSQRSIGSHHFIRTTIILFEQQASKLVSNSKQALKNSLVHTYLWKENIFFGLIAHSFFLIFLQVSKFN